MGVVYRARHEATEQLVAIKIVRVVDEGLLASFRREIFALRCIDHPQVVRIVDDGVEDGRPWYAMELVRGRSLADYIDATFGVRPSHRPGDARRRRSEAFASGELSSPPPDAEAPTIPPSSCHHTPPLTETLSLMRALCVPLAYVHGEGLVHRDLKPENVLIRDDGTPVLLDFGLALHFSGGERARDVLDVAGRALGTPPYMAPEQIRGDLVDARADLYAFGCMLFECVTGVPPFEGTPVKTLQHHLSDPPPLASSFVAGVPPELDALIDRLLRKRPRDRIGFAVDVAAALAEMGAREPKTRGPTPRPYLYRPSLAGRTDILTELKPALEQGATGCGSCVLIGGESGVGKTRLAMELATSAARRGANVVAGQCLDARGDSGGLSVKAAPLHPLRPLLQAIADRCRTAGFDEAERILGDRGPVLAPYAPALTHLPGQAERPAPAELPAEAARFRLFEALATAIERLGEAEPTFLVIDDLQWADELTLAFLQHLDQRFFDRAAVFIVGTYRNDELTEPLREVLASPLVKSVELGMLERDAVSTMVSDMLALDDPPDALVEFLMSESEGNPFFIAEYLRAAMGERILRRSQTGVWVVGRAAQTSDSLRTALPLPNGLRDLVARRLSALDEDATLLVAVAAVIGREIDGDTLLVASHLDTGRGRAALEQLRARNVLEEDERGGLRFVHDKVREVVYDGLAAEARGPLHLAAARAIEAAPGDDASRALQHAVLAHHFSLGGDYQRAIHYLERAGELALASAASSEAKRFFDAALALDREHALGVDAHRRAAWQRRLGEAHYNLGELHEARRWLGASLEALHPAPTGALPFLDEERARALLGSVAAVVAQLKTLAGWQHPVSERPETRRRWREGALAAERLSQVHYFLNEQSLAFGAALRCAELAEGLGPSPELARAYATLSVAMNYVPIPGLMERYGGKAHAIAERVDDPQAREFVAFLLGLNACGAGAWPEAHEHLARAYELALAVGDFRAAQEIGTLRVDALAFHGRCLEALREYEALFELAERNKNKQGVVWAKGTVALTYTLLGRAEDALALYDEIAPITRVTGDTTSQLSESFKALAYMAAGNWSEARRVADEVRALADKPPAAWHCCQGYMGASEVYLAAWERALVGDTSPGELPRLARGMVKTLERAARTFPYARAAAYRLRGLEQWLSGRRRRAERSWQRAIATAHERETPYDEARSHWEIARHQAHDARAREEHGRRARRLFEAIGAERWAELSLQLPRCWR